MEITASMNLGVSPKLNFKDVILRERPLVETQTTDHPDWLAGFFSAEGSFFVDIQKSATHNFK